MARPRKDMEGPGAEQRLRDEFLAMLDEMPYSQIAVSNLCRRAHVNHNTFYYHHESLEAFARDMVAKTIEEVSVEQVVAFVTGDLPEAGNLMGKAQLIVLFLGENAAPWMADMLRDAAVAFWERRLGFGEGCMPVPERMALSVMVGGALSVWSSLEDPVCEYRVVYETEVGKGLMAMVNRLSDKRAPE